MLKNTLVSVLLLFLPTLVFTQTINLGILSSFEVYTGAGAITNTGTVIGDAGSNNGIITGLDPPAYTGTVYHNDDVTIQCRIDLLRLYIHLNDIFVTFPGTHAAAFGSGETISPGVYSIPSAGSIGGTITLDGGGDSDAFFIIKYQGAMTVGAGAEVILSNGTKSCNVFWIAEGAISVAAGAIVKGNLFAKIGAVGLGTNCNLEGRMLTMEGAITNGLGSVVTIPAGVSTIPINCSDDCIPAAAADILGSVGNFALFTSFGAVANTSISGFDGDIGTDAGAISGFGSSIHFGSQYAADAITAQAKIDLDIAYNALLAMTITETHAAAFGSGETINPGIYDIGGAGSLSGTITLDGGGNSDAIFVLKFGGAFTVAAQSKVILANGTRRCNVFWVGGAGVATGAVSIGAFAIMKGTILSHGGACSSGAGAFIEGRQLSTAGAINTNTGIVYNNPDCITSLSLAVAGTKDISYIHIDFECDAARDGVDVFNEALSADLDGDTVADQDDPDPGDANKTFTQYIPSQNSFGTLAFEDLWPTKGDYDFNDFIIEIKEEIVTNADNDIYEITFNLRIMGMGGQYNNDFGITLQDPSSQITVEVFSPHNVTHDVTDQDGKKIITIRKPKQLFYPSAITDIINAESGSTYYTPVELQVVLTVNGALSYPSEYNPKFFIEQQGIDGHEVHLAGNAPSPRMNTVLYGTGDDDTDPSINKYFKSVNNLPWGLYIPTTWNYPLEEVDLIEAYSLFVEYAEENPTLVWYLENLSDPTKTFNDH
jgi:LruC domain-containing protein